METYPRIHCGYLNDIIFTCNSYFYKTKLPKMYYLDVLFLKTYRGGLLKDPTHVTCNIFSHYHCSFNNHADKIFFLQIPQTFVKFHSNALLVIIAYFKC